MGYGVTNRNEGNFLYGNSVNGFDFSALDAFAFANNLPILVVAEVPEPGCTISPATAASVLFLRRRRKSLSLSTGSTCESRFSD